MRVLIINTAGKRRKSQARFHEFDTLVREALERVPHAGAEVLVRSVDELDEFIVDMSGGRGDEGSREEFYDPVNLQSFDRLDMIFISGETNLTPWGPAARQLHTLLLMCYQTGKCVFGCMTAIQMLSYVLACDGKAIELIDAYPTGGTLKQLEQLDSSIVAGLQDGQYFLNQENGDVYQWCSIERVWRPVLNIGMQSHTVPRKRKYEVSHRQQDNLDFGAEKEVRCQRRVNHLHHWLFDGLRDNSFTVPCYHEWDVHVMPTHGARLDVLADSEFGIQIAELGHMVVMQFSIRRQYPTTVRLLNNYVQKKFMLMLSFGRLEYVSQRLFQTTMHEGGNVKPYFDDDSVLPPVIVESVRTRIHDAERAVIDDSNDEDDDVGDHGLSPAHARRPASRNMHRCSSLRFAMDAEEAALDIFHDGGSDDESGDNNNGNNGNTIGDEDLALDDGDNAEAGFRARAASRLSGEVGRERGVSGASMQPAHVLVNRERRAVSACSTLPQAGRARAASASLRSDGGVIRRGLDDRSNQALVAGVGAFSLARLENVRNLRDGGGLAAGVFRPRPRPMPVSAPAVRHDQAAQAAAQAGVRVEYRSAAGTMHAKAQQQAAEALAGRKARPSMLMPRTSVAPGAVTTQAGASTAVPVAKGDGTAPAYVHGKPLRSGGPVRQASGMLHRQGVRELMYWPTTQCVIRPKPDLYAERTRARRRSIRSTTPGPRAVPASRTGTAVMPQAGRQVQSAHAGRRRAVQTSAEAAATANTLTRSEVRRLLHPERWEEEEAERKAKQVNKVIVLKTKARPFCAWDKYSAMIERDRQACTRSDPHERRRQQIEYDREQRRRERSKWVGDKDFTVLPVTAQRARDDWWVKTHMGEQPPSAMLERYTPRRDTPTLRRV